jgi:hypothetical protein
VLTLVGFGAVAAAGAVGFELRERAASVRPVSILLLALNAFVLAAAAGSPGPVGDLARRAVGCARRCRPGLLRAERASRAVGIVALALGAVLADVALAGSSTAPR